MMRRVSARAWLNLLAMAGAGQLSHRMTRSPGVIIRLERVLPLDEAMARPPGAAWVTPSYLRRLVLALRRWGYDIVSLDDMTRRIQAGVRGRTACLTFDGGYRDVQRHAWPVLRSLQAPFAVYVMTNFADHVGEPWWLVPEALVARVDRIGFIADDKDFRFVCANAAQKREVRAAMEEILWSLPRDADIRLVVRDLCTRYGVDLAAMNRLFLSWDELREMAAEDRKSVV